MSLLLALVALLYVSTLVGLITTALTERLTALRRGRSTVLEHGHAVVLGWSEQVFTVVGELVAANANQPRAAVAVLADRDKTAMEEAFAAKVGPLGRTRLICRSGPTTDPDVLALAGPATAGVVLVLPHDDPDADAEVVKTLLALRRALAGAERRPPVVAAVRDDRYRLAASLAAGPDGVVLESDTVTARMIVQAARRPGLSLVHQELLDFAGEEFYLVAEASWQGARSGTRCCPTGRRASSGWCGETFPCSIRRRGCPWRRRICSSSSPVTTTRPTRRTARHWWRRRPWPPARRRPHVRNATSYWAGTAGRRS